MESNTCMDCGRSFTSVDRYGKTNLCRECFISSLSPEFQDSGKQERLFPKYQYSVRKFRQRTALREADIRETENIVRHLGWKIVMEDHDFLLAEINVDKVGYDQLILFKMNDDSLSVECAFVSETSGTTCKETEATISLFAGEYLRRFGLLPEIGNTNERIDNFPETGPRNMGLVENKKGAGYLLVPRPGYLITPLVILVNLVVFALMTIFGVNPIAPQGPDLIRWGANVKDATLDGQLWRLLTCCFVHAGILHLLVNMYSLSFVGLFLEPLIRWPRLLLIYLVSGIAASSLSLFMHKFSIVSIGASGAIFGLYGTFLALLTTKLVPRSFQNNLLLSVILFVAYNLFLGRHAGIDNAAHLGGFVSGLLLGYGLYGGVPTTEIRRRNALSLSAAVAAVLCSAGFLVINSGRPMSSYEQILVQTLEADTRMVNAFKKVSQDPSQVAIVWLLSDGKPFCENNIKTLSDLKIPSQWEPRFAAMIKFSTLRQEYFDLIYNALIRHSTPDRRVLREKELKMQVLKEEILPEKTLKIKKSWNREH